MSESKLADLTATEAAEKIRTGEITSEMMVGVCFERIAERDGEIGAWAHLDQQLALRQARAADAWRATGVGIGPLHGVPVGIKDIIDTEDMPTENGSPIFKGRQPTADAACVTALRQAGAIILGKTITTELASLTPAATRNPSNSAHTPGGSSSGSAAAVASCMVPLALGTQTAGSVIRPASYCGVYAMKPTFGLVSRTGVTMQSHTLDTIGVFARSVEDLGLTVDCLSGRDTRDAASYPRSRGNLTETLLQEPPLPPSIAFWRTPAWPLADPVMRDAFAELAETLGDRCDSVELPEAFDEIVHAQQTIQLAENATYYGPLLDRARPSLSTGMAERLERGAAVPARDYLKAVNSREVLYAGLERIFERYDAIICPAAPGPAPLGLGSTGDPVFNGMWTFLGVPCVTLPLLEAGGLPIGVQLVGPRRDDGRLLRTARWLERWLRAQDGG